MRVSIIQAMCLLATLYPVVGLHSESIGTSGIANDELLENNDISDFLVVFAYAACRYRY